MTAAPILPLESRYARDLEGLYAPWQAAPLPSPRLLALNEDLARALGLDPRVLASSEGLATLLGQRVVDGAAPLAMAYAGHQFGNYSPRLGDGRALLLGELVDSAGQLFDLHLKGSGPTPFARGGDGKAAVGPMLREYLISEAMHALGIPTTRALAVVATGEKIERDGPLPGAVLVRVAASHLRVGHFEYAAAKGDAHLLRRLADHAIARHCPEAAGTEAPYIAFYEHVLARQAELVAAWMQVGFVHGVMNTDNTTISGETIDYGPCAFMDRHDSKTVFSSIDHGGRYAYGNQPAVLQWNLARFAEAILPLLAPDQDRAVALATAALERFAERFLAAWRRGLEAKLGLAPLASQDGGDRDGSAARIAFLDAVPALLESQRVDHTLFFRQLSAAVRGDPTPVRALFADPNAFDAWAATWHAARLESGPASASDRADTRAEAIATAMDRVNPIYIPRNHRVEEALSAATLGDLAPFRALLGVVIKPFEELPGQEAYAQPAPPGGPPYRTYCGT